MGGIINFIKEHPYMLEILHQCTLAYQRKANIIFRLFPLMIGPAYKGILELFKDR